MNALKFILNRNHMTQKEFADVLGLTKQSVTRWVLQQKPMHEDYIKYVEENFHVKRKYFVNERRYVKLLDENELLALEDYLLRQKFEQPTSTKSKYLYSKSLRNLNEEELQRREYLREKYLVSYRNKKINVDIQHLAERLKKDVRDIGINDDYYSYADSLDLLDDNISFYEKFFHLRESKKISEYEWDVIFSALFILTAEETDIQADDTALEIYNLLKKHRRE